LQQELPSSILRTVRSFCHCHPLSCTVELLLHDSFVFVFRVSAPLLHNFVICAGPFPPDFGLFFALPASFVAAIGLPLRLFVPQAAQKSRPRHPRAPRRRMSSRMVRNSKKFGANAVLASKSINSHGTLPLSSPSSEMRGELSDRPCYECCFSTFRPSVPQH